MVNPLVLLWRCCALVMFMLFSQGISIAQSDTNVYLFPGQGADDRLFSALSFPAHYKVKVIAYGTPAPTESLREFALRQTRKIDRNSPFILIGTSLGGMMCVELAHYLKPAKTIIISSAKTQHDLPFRYKFQQAVPLYKVVPGSVLLFGAKFLQPIVEPDRNRHKEVFKSMLSKKTPRYMKRTIGLIIQWDREECTAPIIHIHGTNDHTLPGRKIKGEVHWLEGGSHMMTLTEGDWISKLLRNL